MKKYERHYEIKMIKGEPHYAEVTDEAVSIAVSDSDSEKQHVLFTKELPEKMYALMGAMGQGSLDIAFNLFVFEKVEQNTIRWKENLQPYSLEPNKMNIFSGVQTDDIEAELRLSLENETYRTFHSANLQQELAQKCWVLVMHSKSKVVDRELQSPLLSLVLNHYEQEDERCFTPVPTPRSDRSMSVSTEDGQLTGRSVNSDHGGKMSPGF